MTGNNVRDVGEFLKNQREIKNQTLAEVSGAVEIDVEQLRMIEEGRFLPEEETLVTLISFLKISDEDAKDIFEKAGYLSEDEETFDKVNTQPTAPVLYADSIKVIKSNDGVVIDFFQPSTDGGVTTFRFGINDNLTKELTKQLMQTLSLDNTTKKISNVSSATTHPEADNQLDY